MSIFQHVVLQGACTGLVVIAYVWFVCGFAGLLDKKGGYSAFQTVSCFKVELLVALEALCRLCYVSDESTVLIRSFFDQIMDKTCIKQRSCEHID